MRALLLGLTFLLLAASPAQAGPWHEVRVEYVTPLLVSETRCEETGCVTVAACGIGPCFVGVIDEAGAYALRMDDEHLEDATMSLRAETAQGDLCSERQLTGQARLDVTEPCVRVSVRVDVGTAGAIVVRPVA